MRRYFGNITFSQLIMTGMKGALNMSMTERLRQKRQQFKLRQEDVSRYLGFESKNAYWSIENGRTKLQASHLLLLTKLYNVSADYFLSD